MNPNTLFCALACGLFAVSASAPAVSLEVYQWTDENGVIHFSQWAPEEDVGSVETVTVQGGGEKDNGIGISERDDPEGYKAHREEMAALWAEIEARQQAERQARRNAPQPEIVYVGSEDPYQYEYPWFFGDRGFGPPFRPVRPEHHRRDDDHGRGDRGGRGEGRGDRPPPSVPFRPPGR